jgi:hypothetical protein
LERWDETLDAFEILCVGYEDLFVWTAFGMLYAGQQHEFVQNIVGR